MNKEEVYKLIEDHYRDNFNRMVKYISRNSGNRHNAEDILQEAYTRALLYWKSLEARHDKSMNEWFRGILKNCFRDSLREQLEKGIVVEGHVDKIVDHNHSGYARKWLKEIKEKMRLYNKKDEYILNLYFIYQYKIYEIEMLVRESFIYVKNLVQKFRRELREDYGK